jgi:3-hydroxyisobutyrate dehydrogenase-like beta-hydroxyacid dehydrogenase
VNETTIAVLGLGEAGGAFASDLVAAGAIVRGYDPVVTARHGVYDCTDEADAVRTAELILSVNSASAAVPAFVAAADHVRPGAVWADLNTAEPSLKRTLGALASARGVIFADVSIMAPVPGRGLATPLLGSGAGARVVARLLGRYGAAVTALDQPAGAAAERKLLRSVFYKGMSAAVVEALAAARVLGLEQWLRDNIAEELTNASPQSVDRIVSGTYRHAPRRADEMEAAAKMLAHLGVDHDIADASALLLRRLSASPWPR